MSDTERASLIGELHGIQRELDSAEFPCGDWKLNKVLEYERLGKPCPYTTEEMEEYFALRQEKRDRINEIRNLLEEGTVEQVTEESEEEAIESEEEITGQKYEKQ